MQNIFVDLKENERIRDFDLLRGVGHLSSVASWLRPRKTPPKGHILFARKIPMWFKADVKGFLRDEKLEDVELRGAWISVLALCKFCNHNGLFIDSLETALTDGEICRQARINLVHLESLRTASLLNFVTIGVTKVTNIPNWLKYQPEYDRQKPYRQAKREKANENNKFVTPAVTMTHIETRDLRLEKEREKRDGDLRELNNSTSAPSQHNGDISNDILEAQKLLLSKRKQK